MGACYVHFTSAALALLQCYVIGFQFNFFHVSDVYLFWYGISEVQVALSRQPVGKLFCGLKGSLRVTEGCQ